jgi:outer membrane protein assembly factor BamB
MRAISSILLLALILPSTSFGAYELLPVWTVRLAENENPDERFKQMAVMGLAIDGDSFYLATPNKTVDKRFLSSGEIKWSTKLEGQSQSNWVYSKGELFGGDTKGFYYCINATDGSIKWKKQTKGVFYSKALVDDKQVYTMNSLGTLVAYDRATGEWKWQEADDRTTNLTLWSFQGPIFFEGKVVAGFPSSVLKAFDPESGTRIWTEDFHVNPTGADNFNDLKAVSTKAPYLFASSFGGDLRAWKAMNGSKKQIWQKKTPLHAPVTATEAGFIYLSTKDGFVQKLDLETGYVKWQFKLPEGQGGQPILLNDKIWVTTSKGRVYVLDQVGNKIAESESFQSSIWNAPVIINDNEALVITSRGIVRRLKVMSVKD